MEQNGYVKLHRTLLNNPISQKPQYAWLWTTLLLLANHKPNKFMWNGKVIIVKEGQLLTGRKQLSQRTGISESTVERILKYLENEHQIGQQKTNKFRLITVINWIKYQSKDSTLDNKRTTSGQQVDTNKNEKNEKKNIPRPNGRGEKSTKQKRNSSSSFGGKKNIGIAPPFHPAEYFEELLKSDQEHIKIIGWYMRAKGMDRPGILLTKQAAEVEMKRNLRVASRIVKMGGLKRAVITAKKIAPKFNAWTLETVEKQINLF